MCISLRDNMFFPNQSVLLFIQPTSFSCPIPSRESYAKYSYPVRGRKTKSTRFLLVNYYESSLSPIGLANRSLGKGGRSGGGGSRGFPSGVVSMKKRGVIFSVWYITPE